MNLVFAAPHGSGHDPPRPLSHEPRRLRSPLRPPHDRPHRTRQQRIDQAGDLAACSPASRLHLRAGGLESRTSPSAACCSSASAPPSPSGAPARRIVVEAAAERASPAGEMALIDLGQCIERLSRNASPTCRRAACRSASSIRPARPRACCRRSPRRRRGSMSSSSAERAGALSPVLAASRGHGRSRAAAARSSSPRTGPMQRHPCLRGDEAPTTQRAGLPVFFDMVLGARAELAARRAYRHPDGDLRRRLLRRGAARLGPGPTRPATPPSRPAWRWPGWPPTASAPSRSPGRCA